MSEKTLEDIIVGFPGFVLSVILGLAKAVLSEADTFLVVVFGTLVGVLTEPLIGVTVGLGLYLGMRLVAQAFDLVARNLNLLAAVIRDKPLPEAQAPPQTPPEATPIKVNTE